jgi:hypothetical protein
MPGVSRHNESFRAAILDLLARDPSRSWSAEDIHAKVMSFGSLEAVRRQIQQLRDGLHVVAAEMTPGGRVMAWRLGQRRRSA